MIVKREFKNTVDAIGFLSRYAEDTVDAIDVIVYEHVAGSLTEKDFKEIEETFGADVAKKVRVLYTTV